MLSRKDFLKTSALGTLGVLLTGKLASAEDLPFTALKGNTKLFTKSGGTILIHQSKYGLVVVDTQYPDNVSPFISHFGLSDSQKIDFLINTHHHGDHTGGNQVLGPVAKNMVAHKRVPELLLANAKANGKEAGLIPTITFESTWKQDLGTEIIHAYHFGSAHTSGDAVIYFEKDGVAHMGDLIFNRAHPFVDRRSGASMQNWATYLGKTVETLPKETVYVFGHASKGNAITGSYKDVEYFKHYLEAVVAQTKMAIDKKETKEQIMANVSLTGFDDVQSLSARLDLKTIFGLAYDELTGA